MGKSKFDILSIGHTWYNENGFLVITCPYDETGEQEESLKEILQCFGKDYGVIRSYILDDEQGKDTEYLTNLPYHLFDSLGC